MCGGSSVLAASPVSSARSEASKLPFGWSTGREIHIMCEQTEISSLSQPCLCLAEPPRVSEQNPPLVKQGRGLRADAESSAAVFSLPAGWDCIVFSFSSQERKVTEGKWLEAALFY